MRAGNGCIDIFLRRIFHQLKAPYLESLEMDITQLLPEAQEEATDAPVVQMDITGIPVCSPVSSCRTRNILLEVYDKCETFPSLEYLSYTGNETKISVFRAIPWILKQAPKLQHLNLRFPDNDPKDEAAFWSMTTIPWSHVPHGHLRTLHIAKRWEPNDAGRLMECITQLRKKAAWKGFQRLALFHPGEEYDESPGILQLDELRTALGKKVLIA